MNHNCFFFLIYTWYYFWIKFFLFHVYNGAILWFPFIQLCCLFNAFFPLKIRIYRTWFLSSTVFNLFKCLIILSTIISLLWYETHAISFHDDLFLEENRERKTSSDHSSSTSTDVNVQWTKPLIQTLCVLGEFFVCIVVLFTSTYRRRKSKAFRVIACVFEVDDYQPRTHMFKRLFEIILLVFVLHIFENG